MRSIWKATNNSSWFKDATAEYSEDCSLGINTNAEIASNVILYPIPSNETLAVESPYKIEGMRIFDALGQEVLSNFNATTIDITYLTSGIYFLKAETDQGSIVKRFTKE